MPTKVVLTSNSSNHEFNESDLSSNYEIDEKLGKFKCDLCTEMFSSDYISVLSVCRHPGLW